jgi:lysozyme
VTLRDRILVQALASVGLGADPAHVSAFAAFLGGPGERPEVSHEMATAPQSSTCGLTLRAWLRDAGVDDARLRAPYRIGAAISDLLALAHEHGAWIEAKPGLRPKPGDIVGLQLFGPDAGRHAHVFVIVDALDATHPVSVDGGQLDEANRQCIHRRLRTWSESTEQIFDSAPGSLTRVVSGWIDVDRLEDLATTVTSSKASSTPPSAEIIDVSQFNGSVDFARVKAAGIAAVYIRALIGRDDRDARLIEHANGARAAGLPFGVYGDDFPRHGRPQDACVQARQLAAIHHEVGASLLPMIDVEPEGIAGVTGAEWAASVEAYVEAIELELGRPPLLYTGPGFWSQYPELGACNTAGRCPLWMAAYLQQMPPPFAPWASVSLWQYCGDAPGFVGHVAGVSTPVDRTRALKALDAFRV